MLAAKCCGQLQPKGEYATYSYWASQQHFGRCVLYYSWKTQNIIQNNLNEEKVLQMGPGTSILKIKGYALTNIWLNISKIFEDFYIMV